MNTQRLKTFLILADCLNVTETANRLFCTQPAVSIQIKKLEDEMGCILFERLNNRLFLTEKGRIFRQYAMQVLRTLEVAYEHLHQYDDPHFGKINFGASHFVGVYFLPQIIAQYKQRHPQVEVSMDILPSQQLIQRLENNEVEFLVMSDQVQFEPNVYHSYTFLHDHLILVVSPQHHLAQQKSCLLQQLSQEILLIKPYHSATRKFLLQHLSVAQINNLNLMEINSLEGIKQCVMQNLGVAIVSKLAVKNELALGLLVEVEICDMQFKRRIHYIHHKAKYLSPALQQFLEILRKYE